MRLLAEYIAFPIAFIINKCIDCKTLPYQMKVARICSIPKVKKPASTADFRTISILLIVSKIFERIVLK